MSGAQNSAGAAAPADDKNTQTLPIPEPNADGKIVLTEEELIETVAKVIEVKTPEIIASEKNKLYASIEHKDNAIKDLSSKVDTLLDEKKKRDEELETLRQANMTEEQKKNELLNTALTRVDQLTTAFKMLETETNKKITEKDLELHKKDIIASAQGAIIPEMVFGNSLEELNANAEKAKARYSEIVSKATQNITTTTASNTEPSKKDNLSPTPHQKLPEQTPAEEFNYTAKDLLAMDPKKFVDEKEKILAKYGL